MVKVTGAKLITANDLLSGEVVYLTASGAWSRSPDNAEMLHDDSTEAQRLAEVLEADTSVIGPYLAQATRRDDGAIVPSHFREVFRTTGPSNRFIGKQAA